MKCNRGIDHPLITLSFIKLASVEGNAITVTLDFALLHQDYTLNWFTKSQAKLSIKQTLNEYQALKIKH